MSRVRGFSGGNQSAAVVALLATVSFSMAAGAQETPAPNEPAEATRTGQEQSETYGFDVELGALVLDRTMTLQADADTIEHAPRPYVGGWVRAGVVIAEFQDLDAALELDGEFGYGVAKNSRAAVDLGREPVTQLSMGGGRLGVRRALSDQWSLYLGLGSHVTSFIVEANLTYTGHRYIAGEAALGLGWLGESVPLAVDVELAALPVLGLNQSSGGYGGGSAFGARAEAALGWNFLERDVRGGYAGARLSLRYRYQRFRSVFPERRISLGGGRSVDQQHFGLLTIGYHL